MAVAKYGALVTEVKGSISGITFQKMGQSLGIRANPSHKAPNSTYALNSRMKLCTLASFWRGLTPAQKDAWSTQAATYPSFDKFGNAKIMTGYQLFQYINRVKQLYNPSPVATATAYAPPTISDIDFNPYSVAGSSWTLLWNNAIAAGTYVIVYISIPYNGIAYIASPKYYFGFLIAPGTAVGTNFYSTVQAAFRIKPAVGQTFYWKAVKLNITTGQWIIDNGSGELVTS
jgi:hypothetical protein